MGGATTVTGTGAGFSATATPPEVTATSPMVAATAEIPVRARAEAAGWWRRHGRTRPHARAPGCEARGQFRQALLGHRNRSSAGRRRDLRLPDVSAETGGCTSIRVRVLRDFPDASHAPQHRPPARGAGRATTPRPSPRSSTPGWSPTSDSRYQGAPVVIPMAYARVHDTVYVHGSTASRIMRTLKTGDAMCMTVTLVDGIVLARSAFNMSMNYRAVVIHGHARLVADPDERMTAFRAIMEHVVPGHWDQRAAAERRASSDRRSSPRSRSTRCRRRCSGRPARGRARGPRPPGLGRRDPAAHRRRTRRCADDHVPAGVATPASVAEYARRVRDAGAPVGCHDVALHGQGTYVCWSSSPVSCALALVVVGTRYFWVRHERQDAEHTVAGADPGDEGGTRAAAQGDRRNVHWPTSTTPRCSRSATASARSPRRCTQTSTGPTRTSPRRRSERSCPAPRPTTSEPASRGSPQALNQLAVGDCGAIASLQAVEGPCRAAGIP